MTDHLTLEWTPTHGPTRKVVFEPSDEPDENAWVRREFERRNSQWRQVGTEFVADVSCSSDQTDSHSSDQMDSHSSDQTTHSSDQEASACSSTQTTHSSAPHPNPRPTAEEGDRDAR